MGLSPHRLLQYRPSICWLLEGFDFRNLPLKVFERRCSQNRIPVFFENRTLDLPLGKRWRGLVAKQWRRLPKSEYAGELTCCDVRSGQG